MWLLRALTTIPLGLSTCGVGCIDRAERVEVVIRNQGNATIQNAKVWLSRDPQAKDFPPILPGQSGSVTINLPEENNGEFAFTSGNAGRRYVTVIPAFFTTKTTRSDDPKGWHMFVQGPGIGCRYSSI